MVEPIPEGLEGRIVPYLLVGDAAAAIDFYVAAFGAEERYRMAMPDGGIGHAEIVIDGATVYLADAPPEAAGSGDPSRLGGTTVLLHRYVADCDAAVQRAEAAGATVPRPPQDEFYGDRAATVQDPFGHQWSLHTQLRVMSPEDMEEAMRSISG